MPSKSTAFFTTAIALTYLALGSWSCNSPAPAPNQDTHSAAADQGMQAEATQGLATVDLHVVQSGPDHPQGSKEFHFNGKSVFLGPPQPFHLKRASAGQDAFGFPALEVTVVDTEADLLHNWSGEHINELVAIVVDGKVLCIPSVRSPLSASFLVEGGSDGFDPTELDELVKHLEGQ